MTVSIITVSFNSENTIRTTIESVLNQTYDKIEYIVVDGLSSDKTVEIAKEYEDKFREKGYTYKIISEKDNGIFDAMNKGIAMASGEIIGIINSDDWYEPIAVETVVNTYNEEKFDVFYADLNIIKDDKVLLVKHSKYKRLMSSRHWNHPTTFVTKQAYNDLGVYKDRADGGDWDFILRVRKSDKKIVIKNIVLANFRLGGVSNQKTVKEAIKRCKCRYRVYRNNGYSRFYIFECMMMEFVKLIKA